MKKVAIFLIIAAMTFVSKAQTTDPLNSNYLINQGVSPRVLDFAANSSLQDGRNEGWMVSYYMMVDGWGNS